MRVALVGTGLIGASVGLAAKQAGAEVVGFDPDPNALEGAVEKGAVDEAAPSREDALQSAELAVVAAPVAQLAREVTTVLAAAPEECTVTDVGSTKSAVCAGANGSARFVGGHPVCGSEARGPEHASGELFQGATWFLTPLPETDAAALPARPRVRLRARRDTGRGRPRGARPDRRADEPPPARARQPDRQPGRRDEGRGARPAAVRGWLAARHDPGRRRQSAHLGRHLPRQRGAVERLAGEHRRRIEKLEEALAAGDAGFVARWIGEASGNRRRMLEVAYPDPGALHRLRVHVPDRAGVLAAITQGLGAERINIEDFELQHLSPERGGVLMLLISGEREANRAAELLEQQGYGVVVSPIIDE